MARIQILELPKVHVGDVSETPFVLVVDETSYPTAEAHLAAETWWRQFAGDIGACGCLVTDDTFDTPAKDFTVAIDEAFKSDIENWAAGTNETIMRIVEAMSHPRNRAPRSDAARSHEEQP